MKTIWASLLEALYNNATTISIKARPYDERQSTKQQAQSNKQRTQQDALCCYTREHKSYLYLKMMMTIAIYCYMLLVYDDIEHGYNTIITTIERC